MTIKQYIKKLDTQFTLKKAENIIQLAVFDTHNEMSKRIFGRGQNMAGLRSKYKHPYSSWFYPNKDKVRRIGSKKRYKSYRDYKRDIGFSTAFVNFELTGELMKDFNNAERGVLTQKTGVMSWKISLKRSHNIDKSEGLEGRYGLIFGITKREKNRFKNSFKKNMKLFHS